MTKVLAINGSYRDDGMTDKTLSKLIHELEILGAEVEVIFLRNYPIEFCLNCRECTQKSGDDPGECVQHDGMQALINKIEQADAYILAAPTNFGSVTAIFKRFMERLIVYADWPWDKNYPKFRKAHAIKKKALLISSCAAPGILGRWLYSTEKQLKMTAKIIGSNVVGTVFTGLIGKENPPELPVHIVKSVKKLARELV